MVTVIDYVPRKSEQGEPFFALIVQGGVEVVPSQSGNCYVTARKASLPSTFDEATCKALIGQKLPGRIERVDCDPYEYTAPGSGESILLAHTYQFIPEGQMEPVTVPDHLVL